MSLELLEQSLNGLTECELRRCGIMALALWRSVDDVPGRLRDIDAAVFRGFGMRDVPAEVVEADYDHALALLGAFNDLQARLRSALHERFGLRCIVGGVGEPYDERSARFTAAAARPTGNPALDWHVAETLACGYEWDGTPPLLLPARVAVYRYDSLGPEDDALLDDGVNRGDDVGAVVPETSAQDEAVRAGGAAEACAEAPVQASSVTLVLPDGTRRRFSGEVRICIEEGDA